MNEPFGLEEVYEELRKLAAAKLAREAPGQTIDATELVHEAWMGLAKADITWEGKTHFLRTSARAMRRLLVDRARAKLTAKRNKGLQVSLAGIDVPMTEKKILDLDLALNELTNIKPLHGQLMELRYFAGMTIDESAETLGISASEVDRMVRYAKAWLRAELSDSEN